MSLRRVEARFLLSHTIRTAVVIGDLPGWREGLDEAGVETATAGGSAGTDLAVAPAAQAREALSAGARAIVLEGYGGARMLRSARLQVQRFLPLPGAERPDLFLPLDQPLPARYALGHWAVPRRRMKQARNRILSAFVARGAFPPLRPLVSIAQRDSAPPFFAAAAHEFGVPSEVGWFAALGEGPSHRRGVLQLFERQTAAPTWVVKFARIPGLRERFDAEERGLALAAAAGPLVAARAPRLLGRFRIDELDAALETAAIGARLTSLLLGPSTRARKLRTIEGVAEWLVAVARTSVAPPERLEEERRRLGEAVLPAWQPLGVPGDLAAALPPVAPVLQHADLGTSNVVIDDRGFTVLDWEDARAHGLPLWDLVYLLEDALAHVDRASDSAEKRHDWFVRLFRGELPSSEILFRWIRRAVEATGVPENAVAPIVTLLWLDRRHRAPLWLSDPRLGLNWDAWSR